MALDVGDRRIGIAVTDRLGITVQGRPTLERKGADVDVEQVLQIIETEDVVELIVGLPINMDGTHSRQTEKTLGFIARLRRRLRIPVVEWDERLTSHEAGQRLEDMGFDWRKRKKHLDELAAILILEDFLSARGTTG